MTKLATPEARKLSALAEVDPEKWSKRVHGALIAEGGNVSATARVLGISPRQLWRWIKKNPSVLNGTEHRKNPALEKST